MQSELVNGFFTVAGAALGGSFSLLRGRTDHHAKQVEDERSRAKELDDARRSCASAFLARVMTASDYMRDIAYRLQAQGPGSVDETLTAEYVGAWRELVAAHAALLVVASPRVMDASDE